MSHVVFLSFYPDLIPRHDLMARAMRKQGWRVSVIAWDRSRDKNQYDDDLVTIGCRSRSQSAGILLRLPILYKKIRKEVNKLQPDVLFISHYFLLPLAKMSPGNTRYKIYDAVEFFCIDLPAYFGVFKKPGQIIIKAIEKYLLGPVNGVLVVDSRDDWFADYYKNMNKPVEIFMNVPSVLDSPPLDEIRKNENTPVDQRQIVAYVGAFKGTKGLKTIFQTIDSVRARYKSVMFEFMGDWQQERVEIEEMIAELDLAGNVRFLGPYKYRDMLVKLSRATMGLALLQGERNLYSGPGGSRKIFAYMQASLPVIASDVGVVCSLVDEIGCGIRVDINNPENIANAICTYLRDSKLAREHGRKGMEAFRGKYNWEIEEPRFVDFITNVTSQ